MRMHGKTLHGVDLGDGDIGIGQALQKLIARHGRKDFADHAVGEVTVAHALHHVGEAGIVGQFGPTQHLGA